MRNGLLVLFWLCVVTTVIRVPVLCYEFWLLATQVSFTELTVWALLTEYLPFLSWLADLITAVLGVGLGGFILGLPATLVTIFKLIFGTLIGIWALDKVREIDALHLSAHKTQFAG